MAGVEKVVWVLLGVTGSIVDMLPSTRRTVTLFNPIVYLISGFRWTFFDKGDVSAPVSFGITAAFLAVCIGLAVWVFKTGYRLKS